MAQQTTERPGERRARRRGLRFYAGLTLLLAGLSVLGYVGWQLYGTNVVSERKQKEIVAETEQAWTVTAADSEAPSVPLNGADALIRIPRFGDDYVMPVQSGVSDGVLAEGYGHFKDSADPGGVGNYALAAHRVTHGEPLKDMPLLEPGDEVLVETKDHVYTYALDTDPEELVVDFTEMWVLDRVPDNPRPDGVEPDQAPGQRLITLTTCAELFHTDTRMIAFGHLVDSAPK